MSCARQSRQKTMEEQITCPPLQHVKMHTSNTHFSIFQLMGQSLAKHMWNHTCGSITIA